jgi:UDP-glucose 4-epimerase
MLREIDRWADAPVWDPEAIAAATKTWFEVLAR